MRPYDLRHAYVSLMIQAGHTVVLIEHNMNVVMDISQRVLVLDSGRLIAEGAPEVVRANPLVLEAYFGR